MREFLEKLLSPANVLHRESDLAEYREDYTEAEPSDPSVVAFVTEVEQIQAIVKEARQRRVPITPRVAGTNVGGLAIPAEGGLVLDMSRMNRIVDVSVEDMYAVIEPGVTQQDMKDMLRERNMPLTLGYSLAPPHTSVLANAVMGGLTNRSLKYGDQSEWIAGLEVVLPDGSLMRTGAWALSEVPFGRVPFPDLTGLFVAWQGTTGIVTKCAFQLWPEHPIRRRLFVLCYSAAGCYKAARRLCKKEICDDIGGTSWPSAKMMMGVKKPDPTPREGEPVFFLYADMTAETDDEMRAKEAIFHSVLDRLASSGERYEEPLDVETLIKVNPELSGFADFPTDLTFLTDHGGGGLTWMGTYGPMSRFEDTADRGMEIMARHGFPPLIVSRPMRGGHFGVLRFISTFDKKDEAQVEAVRAVNRDLLDLIVSRGFIMYKTPLWAWKELEPKLDQRMLEMMRSVKNLLDPDGLLNPGKLGL